MIDLEEIRRRLSGEDQPDDVWFVDTIRDLLATVTTDKWATLETEGEATGCYPCDTCSGYRARGQPCLFCRAALAAKEMP